MVAPETTAPPLPRVFPLDEAARRMGVSEAVLRNMIQSGQIPAFQGPDGQMLVPMTTDKSPSTLPVAVADDDINARLAAIKREDFAHLEGEEIGLSEAAREFGVSPQTIYKWVKRGYIGVIREQGRRKFLNKADVAFCVAVYNVRKPFGSRAPLLTEEGTPYLLKYPRLAALRRRAKNN